MKLRSYAKVNLTLDILGKREDGYHELETVFQHIDLYDEIELTELDSDEIEIECNIEQLQNERNLAYSAASLIKAKYNIENGVRISLKKNIPIGAGLSGGSANAAAVLKGLNLFWDLGLNKDELISLSKKLGMDVAFHILGGTCLGKGRGEKIEKIKDLEKYHVVLVYPGFNIKTKEAYSNLDHKEIGKEKSTGKFIEDYDISHLHNDFEYSIFDKYPKLEEIASKLGKNTLLSGSGSSVFGLFEDETEAKDVYDKLKKEHDNVFLTTTLNKKIELAKEMGFCFGVKRAIEEINKIIKEKKVYVLGKLIHNPQVIHDLERRGVGMVEDSRGIKEGTVVISAHGIANRTIESIEEKGLEVIDLTCPLVKKVHNITKKSEKEGRKIIVYGDKEHTEVRGIVGNLKNYKVIKDFNELTKEDLECKVTLVSQTTRDLRKFNNLAEKMKENGKDVEIKDTICISTRNKQESSIEIAKNSDIMIVIGGKISSNTLRLKEICSDLCETKHIETEKELKSEWFLDKERIGITAGASTPYEIIEKVIRKIENGF